MRRPRRLLVSAALLALGASPLVSTQVAWKPIEGHLLTRFAGEVSPSNAWPEYPRPQLVRKDWVNLNGLWEYALRPKDATTPVSSFDGRILIPYPIESALSGVGKPVAPDQRVWYRRTFEISPDWKNRRLWLRFGAVDWDASVWVNGASIGRHTGGYDPFAFDITSALTPSGPQEIVVSAWDPTDQGDQPRGRQVLNPGALGYTSTTGIWQTVWLEPLPVVAIARLKLVPNADAGTLQVEPEFTASAGGYTLQVTASAGGIPIANAEGPAGKPLTVTIQNPQLWSPEQPFLYNLVATLLKGDRAVDEVRSYAGLRKISLGRTDNGATRLLLNNRPLFQFGLLDQGFWPDGLHTAPSDEALRFDIAATRGFGMNLVRKHIKVEPERWYYWADKLGLLVWQDMPSGRNATPDARANFIDEWQRIIDARSNHPSIVMWVPFNEGCGQPDAAGTREIAERTAKQDPTRLVSNASGWVDSGAGHVSDVHAYPGPAMPGLERGRAAVLGEFGGMGLPVRGHTWQDEKNGRATGVKDAAELETAYRARAGELRQLASRGLSAAVYAQITDVETDTDGLMTYDREIVKIAPSILQDIHKTLYGSLPPVADILPPSDLAPRVWRYTTTAPSDGWRSAGFDAQAWQEGQAPFGSTEGVTRRTAWTTPDIWLRQSFTWMGGTVDGLHLIIAHDGDAAVYINGIEAASLTGAPPGYVMVPVSAGAARALTTGENVIAVQCHQTKGGQAIDVGIVRVGSAR